MKYALKERIGNPDLFIGRKKELEYFLKWINGIKKEKSKSIAILARRKMEKTALLERLYNITFYQNSDIIPFYFEIKAMDIWVGDFCSVFLLTFIYQYIAFKSRKPEYINLVSKSNFEIANNIAKKEGLDYLCDIINDAAHAVKHEKLDILWDIAREAPKTIAANRNEFIVQMIDEFQFFSTKIYRDKALNNHQSSIAGGYLSTAESKIAPLLFSVSQEEVNWTNEFLIKQFRYRFQYKLLTNLQEDDFI